MLNDMFNAWKAVPLQNALWQFQETVTCPSIQQWNCVKPNAYSVTC